LKAPARFSALLFSFLSVALLLFQSCKKDDELGVDLVSLPGDMFGLSYTDTASVIAWSTKEDSLQTSGVYLQLLGSYFDPVFGKTSSSIYTQARLSTNDVNFGTNPVGDSLVLSMQFNGYYGDSLASLRVKVYELDPTCVFSKDSTYYSHQSLPTADLLFDAVVRLNPIDSVTFGGKKVSPMLMLNLGGPLMQKFINASGTSDLADNSAFLKFFKGLYITVEEVAAENEGIIGYFNLKADLSRLTLYYHNASDTLTYPFYINDDCAKFCHFDHHGYLEAETGLNYQDSNGVNPRLYVQAMSGVKVRIKMPHISDLYKDGPIAINRAELVIKTDPSDLTSSTFKPAAKLIVARVTDEGKNAFLSDVQEGDSFMGGTYDADKQEYRFRITRYLYDILSGKYTNNGLVLMVSASSVRAERATLLGNTLSGNNLRVEIVYSKP
jgi:hypothetical protein